MRNRIARQKGFSLLEVLLALTIFGIAFVGIIEGITVHLRAESLAEDTTRAAILAQNVLEDIRCEENFIPRTESGEYSHENLGFKWEYELDETETDNLYKVTIIISFHDGRRLRKYQLESFIAER